MSRGPSSPDQSPAGPRLVVVVARALSLRNVLKLDKQSPFLTLRLLDQQHTTKTIPRAGQNPRWDEDFWFSLQGLDLSIEKNRVLNLSIYHQKKGEAKLVAFTNVDFGPALSRNSKVGWDGWFDVEWDGKVAGKVYLEMTYYPGTGDVPVDADIPGRENMRDSVFRDSARLADQIRKREKMEVPDLELKFKHEDNERDSKRDIVEIDEAKKGGVGAGLFSFLDKKLGLFKNTEEPMEVRRKISSPQLVKEKKGELFGGSSDESDDEYRFGQEVDFRVSVQSRPEQKTHFNEGHGHYNHDDDNEVDEEDDEEEEDLPPPPPPKHKIPTSSFMSSARSISPPSPPIRKMSNMSWYERRMQNRRNA